MRPRAITTKIRSGSFDPAVSPDYGPGGAFRTGSHIMLCPAFFDLRPLSQIQPATVGTLLDNQVNQGTVMLHELMHVYSNYILGVSSLFDKYNAYIN